MNSVSSVDSVKGNELIFVLFNRIGELSLLNVNSPAAVFKFRKISHQTTPALIRGSLNGDDHSGRHNPVNPIMRTAHNSTQESYVGRE